MILNGLAGTKNRKITCTLNLSDAVGPRAMLGEILKKMIAEVLQRKAKIITFKQTNKKIGGINNIILEENLQILFLF